MAEISYDRPVSINPEWEAENLRRAFEKGSGLDAMENCDIREFIRENEIDSEFVSTMRERYGNSSLTDISVTYISELHIENFRCFESLDLNFTERLTAIIGKNGAGKTALLDAVAISLSSFLPYGNISMRRKLEASDAFMDANESSSQDEVAVGQYPVRISAKGKIDGRNCVQDECLMDEGAEREGFRTSSSEELPDCAKIEYKQILPFIGYYSEERIISSSCTDMSGVDWDSRLSGYVGALDGRYDDAYVKSWLRTNGVSRKIIGKKGSVKECIDVVLDAASSCLECIFGYEKVKVIYDACSDSIQAVFSDCRGIRRRLRIASMGEGCRHAVFMTMDIAIRMFALNPVLADAVLSSPGILLIDDIDSHLHPSCHQKIIPFLMSLFPNVQFIASTDSPLIINSVRKENLMVLENHCAAMPPYECYGMEAGSVLRAMMDTSSRPPLVNELFSSFYKAVAEGKYYIADSLLKRLCSIVGSDNPEYREADEFMFLEMGQ